MVSNSMFHKILEDFNLGTLTAQPQRVTGGYMHKMYCLETTTGKYALKLLNPAIMKRPDVFPNYQRAEQLERVLQEHEIPVVPAMEINGHKMQCSDNQYFYIFHWLEGRTLRWEEIRKEHCQIAGTVLARIHKIEQSDQPFIRNEICIDWDTYIELTNESCSEVADMLKNSRELFYKGQNQFNTALKKIPAVTCICDGDMDCKNVLWVNENPVIIDLECLDYGNPFMEMFQLALGWSGFVICHMDYELLKTFISSYHQEYGSFQVDWNALYGIGFIWLEWLEYNIKRALMIECENEEERELGIEQVRQTTQRIIYYNSIKEELLRTLQIYCEEYWCEIMPKAASKANAIEKLK
jgi:Ser/Thr protein kinase RdoA (MazF antagonist)